MDGWTDERMDGRMDARMAGCNDGLMMYPYNHRSLNLSITPYIHPTFQTSIHPSIDVRIHPFIHPSVHPLIYQSIKTSIPEPTSLQLAILGAKYPQLPSRPACILVACGTDISMEGWMHGLCFHPSMPPSFHPCIHPSLHLSICSSIHLFKHPSVHTYIHPYFD